MRMQALQNLQRMGVQDIDFSTAGENKGDKKTKGIRTFIDGGRTPR
jgi:hypothetical protein